MSRRDINSREWSDAVRDSLKGAEVAPSDELWGRVESSLDRPLLSWRKVVNWVAATAAVVALVFVALHDMPSIEQMDGVQYMAHEDVSDIEKDIISEAVNNTQVGEVIAVRSVAHPKGVAIVEDVESYSDVFAILDIEEEIEQTTVAKKNVEDNESVEDESDRGQVDLSPNRKFEPIKRVKINRGEGQTRLALNVGGLGASSASGASYNYQAVQQIMLSNDDVRSFSVKELYGAREISHRMPLSFELSVGRDISNVFSVVSGLSYTLLISDIHMAAEDLTQRLQFIGLPLRLEGALLRRDNFSLYVGAGGRVEYCVSAKVGDAKYDEQSWHYSLNGVVGAEYKFNDWVGLYCEPDVAYYLTQSRLNSIRNESPLSFTMRFGVRFTL